MRKLSNFQTAQNVNWGCNQLRHDHDHTVYGYSTIHCITLILNLLTDKEIAVLLLAQLTLTTRNRLAWVTSVSVTNYRNQQNTSTSSHAGESRVGEKKVSDRSLHNQSRIWRSY